MVKLLPPWQENSAFANQNYDNLIAARLQVRVLSLGLPVWPYAKSVQLKPSIAFLDVKMSSKHAATSSRRSAQHPNTGQLHTKCSIGSTACRSQCLRKSHSASLLLGLQTSTSVDGKIRDTANLCQNLQ